MTRETALQILTKHLTNKILLEHSFATEAVMRSLATLFKGDVDTWGLTGLLHDADYEECKGNPQEHGLLLFKLEPNSIPSIIEHAIKSHNVLETHIQPESPMDWSLYCADELTGMIMQLVVATKSKKLAEITPELVLEKLKDKNFAKQAHKEKIFLCEEKLGIPLEEFVTINLKAMQLAHTELDL